MLTIANSVLLLVSIGMTGYCSRLRKKANEAEKMMSITLLLRSGHNAKNNGTHEKP